MMVAGFAYPTQRRGVRGRRADGRACRPQKRELGHGVPELRGVPAPHRLRQHRVPARRCARRRGPRSASRVGEALELVRLTGYERRLPRQLSGGEQQRVALARALVFRPRVLLMDEPLGALDKKLRAHMQLELKHIQQHLHVTVIYVTHDQEEALTMSDRVAVMQRRPDRAGRAARPSCTSTPASRFVADFIGESNFLDGIAVVRRARRDAGAAAPPEGSSSSVSARSRFRPGSSSPPPSVPRSWCRRGTTGPRRWARAPMRARAWSKRPSTSGTSRATAWASAPTAPSPSRCRTAMPRGRSPPARRWLSPGRPTIRRLFPRGGRMKAVAPSGRRRCATS